MKKNTNTIPEKSLKEKLSASPEKVIDIPGIGKVTVQTPSFDKVVQFARENQSVGEKNLNFALALMAVKELSVQDILELLENNNGIAIAALTNAINEVIGVNDLSVGKPQKG